MYPETTTRSWGFVEVLITLVHIIGVHRVTKPCLWMETDKNRSIY